MGWRGSIGGLLIAVYQIGMGIYLSMHAGAAIEEQKLVKPQLAAVFMVAAAWALQTDDHVRVDIFYRERSPRYQGAVNLAGTLLFLVPFSVLMLLVGWDYVAVSWEVRERSGEPGGLPLVWLLKTLVLVLPVLLRRQLLRLQLQRRQR